MSRQSDLADRVAEEGILRNPLLVTACQGKHFLLDGHHRFETLRHQGCTHVLAQEIPFKSSALDVSSWAHVSQVNVPEQLIDELANSGLEIKRSPLMQARAAVARGEAVCWIAHTDQPNPKFYTVHTGLRPLEQALSLIEAAYNPRRVTREELHNAAAADLGQVFDQHQSCNWCVEFADISLQQMASWVAEGCQIPSGITRISLRGGRVIGANVPLQLLRCDASAASRSSWLARMNDTGCQVVPSGSRVNENGSYRSYAEPLYVFDSEIEVFATNSVN